jgi:hypothetical protein
VRGPPKLFLLASHLWTEEHWSCQFEVKEPLQEKVQCHLLYYLVPCPPAASLEEPEWNPTESPRDARWIGVRFWPRPPPEP